jgi:hypothetical protein
MKRYICIIVLLCLLLCGCDQEQKESIAAPGQSDLKTFSYTEDCLRFADQKVSVLDTQSQEKQPVKTVDDVIAIAKKHCLINNTETMVEYDPLTGVYCVTFIPFFEIDGNILYRTDSSTVHVYVNEDGITLMTVLVG